MTITPTGDIHSSFRVIEEDLGAFFKKRNSG